MSAYTLYLTYDGLTDPLGQSQILPYLTGLSKHGYLVTVISFEKADVFEKEKKSVEEICDEHRISWIPLKYHKYPAVISTLFDLFLLRQRALRCAKDAPVLLVHCRSYLTSLVGLSLKKRFGTKFIFDMRGFWADERVEGRIWNVGNPVFRWIYTYFKRKEREFLREADHVIVLTRKAKEILRSWGRTHQVTIIPCCADTHFFDPTWIEHSQREKFRAGLGLENDSFVLCYVGSTGTWYMLEEMFDFYRALLEVNTHARFLIVTPDPQESVLAHARQRNIDKEKLIIRKARRNEMPAYLSASDFTILFIRPSFSKLASSPTKLGESLAMGVPALANAGVGDNDLFFDNEQIGVLVSQFDDESYRRAAEKMTGFASQKELIRDFALSNLSLKIGLERYDRVYREVLNSASSDT